MNRRAFFRACAGAAAAPVVAAVPAAAGGTFVLDGLLVDPATAMLYECDGSVWHPLGKIDRSRIYRELMGGPGLTPARRPVLPDAGVEQDEKSFGSPQLPEAGPHAGVSPPTGAGCVFIPPRAAGVDLRTNPNTGSPPPFAGARPANPRRQRDSVKVSGDAGCASRRSSHGGDRAIILESTRDAGGSIAVQAPDVAICGAPVHGRHHAPEAVRDAEHPFHELGNVYRDRC